MTAVTRRLTNLLGGLAATALTVALLVGVPWLLTTHVGPPLPTSWPDLDTLRTIATTGVTDTFVVTSLAVIIWIAWTQIALAVVGEFAAALRRQPGRRLPVLPGAQPLAARLVAAILLLVTALQPRPILAAEPLHVTVAATAPAAIDDRPAPVQIPTSRAVAASGTATVPTLERDSWWALAERHLGDGLRWREIRDLNLDRTLTDGTTIRPDTDQLQPGWQLLVPASDQTSRPDRAATSDDERVAADVWEVQRGDHFWGIAEHTLEGAWGRTPTDTEIVGYWQELIDANRDRLAPPGDPDLIHPGQQFDLPAPPPNPDADREAAPTMRAPAPDVADGPVPPWELGELSDLEAQPEPPIPQPDPQPEVEPSPGGSDLGTAEAAPDRSEPDRQRLATPQVEPGDATQAPGGATSALGVPVGVVPAAAAAALASAGIVALLRRRRRTLLQQRLAEMRLPTPAGEGAAHLAMLEHVAPHDDVLENLEALLATIPPDIAPPLLVIHDTGPVSIIVDDTDRQPPTPWQHDQGEAGEPARWTARIGERGPRRSIGLPLLVTLGRTGSTTVLANLGAIGTLTIDGETGQVRTRLRAMTFEVATSRTAGPLDVTIHGDDIACDLDQVRAIDDPTDEIAATAAEADAGIIDDDRIPRLIVSHHTDPDVALPADIARFCAIIRPGAPTGGGWALTVNGEHGWLHIPDGTVEELTLPDLQPEAITAELDRLSPDTGRASPPDTGPASPPDTGRASPPDTDGADEPTTAAMLIDLTSHRGHEPWCEVGLLGPMLAVRDSQPIDSLTPTSRQLLAYLATHPDGVTLERLDDAIWPRHTPSHRGERARTALTRLRRCLGDGPDGQPLLPRREQRDEKIKLSPAVGTDLDRAFQHLATARTLRGDEHLDQLVAALALVRGEPFEDLPVSWSIDIQQRAIAQLQDAALTAAQRLRETGRYTEAEQVITQGLALCDPAEPLYIEWARLEHARGRAHRIPHLWRRLRQRYADDADEIAGTMNTPTIETELAFTALVQSTQN